MKRRTTTDFMHAARALERWHNETLNGQRVSLPVPNMSPLTRDYIAGALAALQWAQGEENSIMEHAKSGGAA